MYDVRSLCRIMSDMFVVTTRGAFPSTCKYVW